MDWMRRRLRLRLIVALVSAALCCAVVELGLQAQEWFRTPMCVRLDERRMYGLNPAYPEISSIGFRNREIVVPKPVGVYRVVILGDSVAFGVGVKRADAFPQRMHRVLEDSGLKIEVINCGIPGYSTYNELELYRGAASSLEADLVMVSVCLNDVVSPRLHWVTSGLPLDALDRLSPDAIPDPASDRDRVRPMLAARRRVEEGRSFVTKSRLLTAAFDALLRLMTPASTAQAPETPTYLSFEDSTSIEVLCTSGSPQSKWLMARLGDLRNAVTANRAELIVLFFPLAYQMDRGYSLSPQSQLTGSCKVSAIASVDILPILLSHSKEKMFRLATGEYYDIWHLTPDGHEVVAQALCAHVLESRARRLGEPVADGGRSRAP